MQASSPAFACLQAAYTVSGIETDLRTYCTGGVFSADNLETLKLGDHKTKTLLSTLTKLGKLRVQVVNGQISGYCMQTHSD